MRAIFVPGGKPKEAPASENFDAAAFSHDADPAGSVIQVRSASRVGYRDRGVNRARIDGLRGGFEPKP